MNTQLINYPVPSACSFEQRIYDHLLSCARNNAPEVVLDCFQSLFLGKQSFLDAEIKQTLLQFVNTGVPKEAFLAFLNRCCFILVNQWQLQPGQRHNIAMLVDLLKQYAGPSVIAGRPSPAGRLRYLVQQFVQSRHFHKLVSISEVFNPQGQDADEGKPLYRILHRYPFLYPHCLTSKEDGFEYQSIISTVKDDSEKKFDEDLSRYLSFSLLNGDEQKTSPQPEKRIITNPTLLSHQDLCHSLRHYVSRVDSRGTLQEGASQFWTAHPKQSNYQAFKEHLEDYLIDSVPAKYGNCRFNDQLIHYIRSLQTQNGDAPLNEFLVVRTCNQLLNFLVVESRKQPKHMVLMDLLNNIGSTATIGLLLRIVLLCRNTKSHLDRRFAILFQHYEGVARSQVKWIVMCLEKLNLAWRAHFGVHRFAYAHLL